MSFEDLEYLYDLLAISIDEVGSANESLFLSKLCLMLAYHVDDSAVFSNALSVAKSDLNP
jgi:hypothetical protein